MKHTVTKIFPVALFIASIALLGFTFLNFNSGSDLNDTQVATAQTEWVLGNPQAQKTIYTYEDFECPYCNTAQSIVHDLVEKHGDSVRVVFRHFPLTEIHPQAMMAAHAAEAAGSQGKFWEMHDLLFENQENISEQTIRELAEGLGLDIKKFEKEMNSQAIREKILNDIETGKSEGVYSTPSYSIDGEVYAGIQTLEEFEKYLQ